jgi:hypothetical protein
MKFDELVEKQETAAPAKRGLSLELRKRPEFIVGGLPTVSLLPRELKAAARGRSLRRMFIGGVVVAIIVAGGATAAATALAGSAQARLDASNATTQGLVAQLGKFRDVQALQQSILLGTAAVQVASSTEIDWQAQIDAIEGDMPSGWAVTGIQADSASPITDYAQGTSPLDQPRAASMQMSITTNDITTVGPWLHKLRTITAYADATAAIISDESSGYTIQLTLHLSPKALISAGKASK